MKKIVERKSKSIVTVALVLMSIVAGACEEGMSEAADPSAAETDNSPAVESETLAAYMATHPNLHLFMNGAHNFREPVYLCFYDNEGNRLNQAPRGKYDSDEGVVYGQFTAVEVPEILSYDQLLILYTTDSVSDCASPMPVFDESAVPPYVTLDTLFIGDNDDTHITIFEGYLSQRLGGENWGDICGEDGDAPCEDFAGLGYAGNILLINPPPAGRCALNFVPPLTLSWQDPEMTLCWDPDDDGAEPSILLTEYPEVYDPTQGGWPDFPPITTGTIHLQSGHVDCAAADLSAALATVSIPTDMTFGPDGGEIAFGPDTSGHIYIMGTDLDGAPAAAGLRIIPILNP